MKTPKTSKSFNKSTEDSFEEDLLKKTSIKKKPKFDDDDLDFADLDDFIELDYDEDEDDY